MVTNPYVPDRGDLVLFHQMFCLPRGSSEGILAWFNTWDMHRGIKWTGKALSALNHLNELPVSF